MDAVYESTVGLLLNGIREQMKNLEFEKPYMIFCWEKGDFKIDEERIREKYLHEIKFRVGKSDEVRRRIPAYLQIPYGPSEREKFDLFGYHTLPKDSPILIFVHGGAWMSGCREEYSYVANQFYNQSIVTAVLGYNLAPDVSLSEMVDEVRRGVKAIRDYVQPSRQIYLSGVSAGAHLISSAVMLDSSEDEALQVDGLILIAGVYVLDEHFQKALLMKNAKFETDQLIQFSLHGTSPKLIGDRLKDRCKNGVFLTVGEWDCSGVRDQYGLMKEILSQTGVQLHCKIIPELDHIEITMNIYHDDILTQVRFTGWNISPVPSLDISPNQEVISSFLGRMVYDA